MSLWQQENEIHTIGLPVECVLSNPVKKAYIYLKKLSLNEKKYLRYFINIYRLKIVCPKMIDSRMVTLFSKNHIKLCWLFIHAKVEENCKIEKHQTGFFFTHNVVYQFLRIFILYCRFNRKPYIYNTYNIQDQP